MIIGPKFPSEVKVVTFSFAQDLGDATIAVVSISCTVLSGVDPDASSMINGPSLIQQGAKSVSQRFSGGVDGVKYLLMATATDSDQGVHVVYAILTVRIPRG